MAGTLAVANGIAKITGHVHADLQPTMPRLYNRFGKGEGKPTGDRGYEISLTTALPFNFGTPGDGADMPVGESLETQRALVFTKRFTLPIRLTGKSMQTLGKNAKNFSYLKDWGKLNLDGGISAAHKIYNILGYGTGNGRLATISTGANSTTQTVNNDDKDRFLRKNMRISIVSSDFATVRGSQRITSESGNNSTTFTIAEAISSTTGDYVIAQNTANQCPTGLTAIVDDTTDAGVVFQNINRNTHTRYRGQMVNASSAALSQALLRRMLGGQIYPALHELKRGDYEIWSHPAQATAYQMLGWNKKYFEGSSKSMDLGFITYEFEGLPWVEDIDAPKDDLLFLKWSGLMKFTTMDWEWDETTGSIWRQVPSDTAGVAYKDEFEAYYQVICNYGCPNPQEQGRIHTLAVPTGH